MSDAGISQNIFQSIGLQGMPEAEKEAFLDQMSTLVETKALTAFITGLSEEEQKELHTARTNNDTAAEQAFFAKHETTMQQLITKEINKLKQTITKKFQS